MKEKCKERVWDNTAFRFYPCSRIVFSDGYCWQHHPDTVKARRDKASARWEAKMQNSPLKKAVRRIAELEAEIERLKAGRGGE